MTWSENFLGALNTVTVLKANKDRFVVGQPVTYQERPDWGPFVVLKMETSELFGEPYYRYDLQQGADFMYRVPEGRLMPATICRQLLRKNLRIVK